MFRTLTTAFLIAVTLSLTNVSVLDILGGVVQAHGSTRSSPFTPSRVSAVGGECAWGMRSGIRARARVCSAEPGIVSEP